MPVELDSLLSDDHVSRRRFVTIGAGAIGSLLVAACGSSSSSSSPSGASQSGASSTASGGSQPGAGKTIGVILQSPNVFNNNLATGVFDGVIPAGYKVTGLYSQNDPNHEVANFQSLIAKGVVGIVVLPVTAASAGHGALAAQRAGIPVVNTAWISPGVGDSAYVGRIKVDSVIGAKITAQWIGKQTKPGEVVLVNGGVGDPSDNEYTANLKTELAALNGGWTLAGVQPGYYNRDKAITAAQNLLTAHPNAKIMVTFAAEMGNGVASFLARTNKKSIVHITNDGNAEMLDWMNKGFIAADRFYSTGELGTTGASMLRAFIETKKKSGVVQAFQTMADPKTIGATVKAHPLGYPAYNNQVQTIS